MMLALSLTALAAASSDDAPAWTERHLPAGHDMPIPVRHTHHRFPRPCKTPLGTGSGVTSGEVLAAREREMMTEGLVSNGATVVIASR